MSHVRTGHGRCQAPAVSPSGIADYDILVCGSRIYARCRLRFGHVRCPAPDALAPDASRSANGEREEEPA
jgi:hypothetical protein